MMMMRRMVNPIAGNPFDWELMMTTMADCYPWASPLVMDKLTIFQVMMYLRKKKKYIGSPKRKSTPVGSWAEVKKVAARRQVELDER